MDVREREREREEGSHKETREGKNNRCRKSRCRTFFFVFAMRENNWTGGARK